MGLWQPLTGEMKISTNIEQHLRYCLSVETQQNHYITQHVREWRALLSQQWVQKDILGSSNSGGTKNVKFSEESHNLLVDNISQMRKERNAEFYEREAFKEKLGRATENKWIHDGVKRSCLQLIIELGRKV